MPTYAAFLRGVMPQNAKMAELKHCFQSAGFANVKTVLGSGNVIFTARASSRAALEHKIEAALQQNLDRVFPTTVRSIEDLQTLLEPDPYQTFKLAPDAKRIVTLLHEKPTPAPKLPIELEGLRILRIDGTEAFSAYRPNPKGPIFMNILEKTFGKDQTTRTWDTIAKVVKASTVS